jgi:hypothetical protein
MAPHCGSPARDADFFTYPRLAFSDFSEIPGTQTVSDAHVIADLAVSVKFSEFGNPGDRRIRSL